MSTLNRASRPSPSAARSATNRNRSKFILAPLITTANFFPEPTSWLSKIYLFKPAKARAPAGSVTERVSVPTTPKGIKDKRCKVIVYFDSTRRTFEYVFDSSTDFVIVDFDYLIEELLADAKGLLANNAHRRAIAERANFGKRDALALVQAARHRVPVKRLDANDLGTRTADALDVFAYARDEASSADSTKDSVEVLGVRELFEDFHRDGALTRDNERVVVRGHKNKAVHGGETGALDLGLVKVLTMEDDFGAKACNVAFFDFWRALGHYDGAWDAEARTGESDALCMVP